MWRNKHCMLISGKRIFLDIKTLPAGNSPGIWRASMSRPVQGLYTEVFCYEKKDVI